MSEASATEQVLAVMNRKKNLRLLEYKIREYTMEPLGRKKIADNLRYLAKFANNDTCFVWLNLRADLQRLEHEILKSHGFGVRECEFFA